MGECVMFEKELYLVKIAIITSYNGSAGQNANFCTQFLLLRSSILSLMFNQQNNENKSHPSTYTVIYGKPYYPYTRYGYRGSVLRKNTEEMDSNNFWIWYSILYIDIVCKRIYCCFLELPTSISSSFSSFSRFRLF